MSFFIIDGHAIAYRSYYAFIRNPLVNSKGENTSAVYGFIRVLLQIMKKENPEGLVCVFDSSEDTQRHKDFPEYKAQREEMPDDMSSQLPVIFDLLDALGIPVVAVPGFEADDIIATFAKEAAEEGKDVRIVTGDKDLFQLLSDRIRIIRPGKGTNLTDNIGPEYLGKKYGLKPDQIVDFLSLMGDSSDNIPGVKGIGEKTALKLLHEYGSLDAILENSSSVEPAHVRKKIEEGKDAALFSRGLVTLVDVPLEPACRDIKRGAPDEERLTKILLDLEFHQIIRELSLGSVTEDEKTGYRLVSAGELEKLASTLESKEGFVLDVETTSLDPMKARIVGIAFCTERGKAWYVPVAAEDEGGPVTLFEGGGKSGGIPGDEVKKLLGPVLACMKTAKTGHNIKYDLEVLEANGYAVGNVTWDTMIASYCLDPSRRSHSLDNLALDHFRHRMIPYKDLFEKGDREKDIRRVPLEKMRDYSCEDADFTFRLKEKFEKELSPAGVDKLFRDIEMPLSFVLKKMEQEGISLDVPALGSLSKEISAELDGLTEEIHREAGEVFNINSNRQLQQILFGKLKLPAAKKTKTGYSTDVDVLTDLAIDHRIAGLLLEYRQAAKLSSTYIDALPALVNPSTGRIHTSFNQTVTATGRLSSSDPNLQNIPVRGEMGRQIRSAFVPRKGNIFIDADYSQIELRIMAHLSRDPELLSAFRDECDIHTRTAARIYDVDEKSVGREMRNAAKTINFGVIYGQGPRALSQQLRIPFEEAKRFIDEYFEKYPGIMEFIEKSKKEAREKGYATTLLGRKRPLPDINSENGRFRSFSERIAVNMPIQGTAADLIKLAMIDIDRAIEEKGLRSRMVLQVHDELLFDVPEEELDEMLRLVRKLMEGAYRLDVPLKVDIGTGANWLEAH